MTRHVRIGVVGFGRMGQVHTRAMSRVRQHHPDLPVVPRLAMVADNAPGSRLGVASAAFGFEHTTMDWHELVTGEVEVVSVTGRASSTVTSRSPRTPASTCGSRSRPSAACRDRRDRRVGRPRRCTVQPGAVLVNCGRGSLVDLDAVHEALVAGVGLDVIDPEPPVPHPIFDRDHVVLTPHLMGLIRRATALTFADAARGGADVLVGRQPAAVANPGCDHTRPDDPTRRTGP